MDAEAAQPQGELAAYIVRTFACASVPAWFRETNSNDSIIAAYLPEAYVALVYSKWLRSLRFGNDYFRLMQADAYYRKYHGYISQILAHASCIVHLAVLADDHDVVLGFSVSRGNVLDYVHVHKDNRRLGIGTKLVPADIDTITHLTKTALTIWGSKFPHLKFNPFA